jgi:DNA-binding MurR/RpiR family transcriptional regulator
MLQRRGIAVSVSISELISEKLGAMPAGERRAAQALIADYPLTGLKTVAEFAGRAGVSSPTILRFVSRLAFQNYADFQSALQSELVEQVQSPLLRTRQRRDSQENGGMAQFAEAVTSNIEETFAHFHADEMKRVLRLLSDPRHRVHLIGGRFTDSLAGYMAAHLRIIRADVFHIAGQEGNWRDHLVDMGKRDVLIIFDIRRYQESLLDFAQKAASLGAAIVLFTDQWLSPVARVARHAITCRTAAPSAWDSSAALFALIEALIAQLTAEGGAKTAKRIASLEDLRRQNEGVPQPARRGRRARL